MMLYRDPAFQSVDQVVAGLRHRLRRVDLLPILHPLRTRRRVAVRTAAELYFKDDADRASALQCVTSSISTGVGLTDYHLLHGYIISRRPSRVLEFGSGKSTLVMAQALYEAHCRVPGSSPGHLYSLEDIPRYHEDIKRLIPDRLKDYVTLIHSPKRESCWRNEVWGFNYAELPSGRFDFVFVDGPTEYQDDQEGKRGKKGACLDLLYLLERDPDACLDVVVDQKFSSLDAYQSVLPRGTVRYDPVMNMGFMSCVRGRLLQSRRPTIWLRHGDAWQLMGLS